MKDVMIFHSWTVFETRWIWTPGNHQILYLPAFFMEVPVKRPFEVVVLPPFGGVGQFTTDIDPLVNCCMTMENHHLQCINQLFLWVIFKSYVTVWKPGILMEPQSGAERRLSLKCDGSLPVGEIVGQQSLVVSGGPGKGRGQGRFGVVSTSELGPFWEWLWRFRDFGGVKYPEKQTVQTSKKLCNLTIILTITGWWWLEHD